MAPQKKSKGKENEENEQGPRNKAPEIVQEKAHTADAVSVDSFQAVDAFCVLRAVFLGKWESSPEVDRDVCSCGFPLQGS